MGNPAAEKAVFEKFLLAAPDFAGESVREWSQPKEDPPDILCTTVSNRKIGLELTAWLDEKQIGNIKKAESLGNAILGAAAPIPPNETKHIHLVQVLPNTSRLPGKDAEAFRAELLALISDMDGRWPDEPSWHSMQGCEWRDFAKYPVLGKYLLEVHAVPRTAFSDWRSTEGACDWITVPEAADFYSPDSMVLALQDRISGKVEKYSGCANGLDEFNLLVHYDLAWQYNSPVNAVDFTSKDAAKAAAQFIGDKAGVFSKVFLFVPHDEEQKVFILYPTAAGTEPV